MASSLAMTNKHLEFKASGSAYNKWLRASLVASLSLPIYGLYYSLINDANPFIVVIACVVVIPLVYIVMRILIARSKIVITDQSITYYGVSGRKRVIDRTAPIKGFFSIYQQGYDLGGPKYELLIIKNKASKKQLRILDAFYSHDALVAVAKAAGISFTEGVFQPHDIEKKRPGLMKFYELHPNWTITISVVVSVIVIGLLIFLIATYLNPANTTDIRFS